MKRQHGGDEMSDGINDTRPILPDKPIPIVEGGRKVGEIVAELRTHQYDGFHETNAIMDSGADEIERLRGVLATIREKLESIVCTEGCDSGIVMLDINGTTHTEIIDGKPMQVYDNEYFSPLGDALMELYEIVGGYVK